MEFFALAGYVLRNEYPGDRLFSFGDTTVLPPSRTRYGVEWISELEYTPLPFYLTLFAPRHSEQPILHKVLLVHFLKITVAPLHDLLFMISP